MVKKTVIFLIYILVVNCIFASKNVIRATTQKETSISIKGLENYIISLEKQLQKKNAQIKKLDKTITDYIFSLNNLYQKNQSLEKQIKFVTGSNDVIIPDNITFADTKIDISSPRIRMRLKEIFDQELKSTRVYITRSGFYFPLIQQILKEYNVPEDLKYLAVAESGLDPIAHSWAGADGIWQFMPQTAREYNLRIDNFVDERRDIYKATIAAAKLLKNNKKYLKKYGADDWLLAMCAYNAGLGNIKKMIKNQGAKTFEELLMSSQETNKYVWRAVAIKIIFENQEQIFGKMIDQESSVFKRFKKIDLELKGYHKLDNWALAQGTNINTIWKNNYWIKIYKKERSRYSKTNNIILPFGNYSFWIPIESKPNPTLLKKELSVLRKKNEGIDIYYKVKKGDTLYKIAKKFKTYIKEIQKKNKLKSQNLKVGQILVINGKYLKTNYIYSKKNYFYVKNGQSLEQISKILNVSSNYLINLNKLKSEIVLRENQKLVY